ncbi:MAG: hypothetical protein IIX60_01260 [Clostridia bacterium]|nr:hypothetical protein [Clostridia bacterium]MBQ2174978.1 hypothetical protein [Alphaproteobacteria bacterium]
MNEFNEKNTTRTEFQNYYYSNSTDAREWLWNVADTAFGTSNAETLEVVDDCEKKWLINYLTDHGFEVENIHEPVGNMCHCDLFSYNPKKNKLYVWETKERDIPSTLYKTALLDDEKTTYLKNGLANFNDLISDTENKIEVVVSIVHFYNDGNVYFFNLEDFNPKWDRVIWTERTHKKKSGSREKVQLLCHFYSMNKPRLMLHDEQVKSFYRN